MSSALLKAGKNVTRDQYVKALTVGRPNLMRVYADYFRTQNVQAVVFPTVPATAPLIDPSYSGALTIDGTPQPGGAQAALNALIRNVDPGSCAGLPGLSLPVALVFDGHARRPEHRWPRGQRSRTARPWTDPRVDPRSACASASCRVEGGRSRPRMTAQGCPRRKCLENEPRAHKGGRRDDGMYASRQADERQIPVSSHLGKSLIVSGLGSS